MEAAAFDVCIVVGVRGMEPYRLTDNARAHCMLITARQQQHWMKLLRDRALGLFVTTHILLFLKIFTLFRDFIYAEIQKQHHTKINELHVQV